MGMTRDLAGQVVAVVAGVAVALTLYGLALVAGALIAGGDDLPPCPILGEWEAANAACIPQTTTSSTPPPAPPAEPTPAPPDFAG